MKGVQHTSDTYRLALKFRYVIHCNIIFLTLYNTTMKINRKIFSKYKYLNHLDRLISVSQGDYTTPPVQVEVDPICVCNFRCAYCRSFNDLDAKHLWSKDFYENIFYDLKSGGVKSVTISGGGEPTLHPDIEKILFHCKKAGLMSALITNGSMLDKKNLRNAILNSCEGIRVSLGESTAKEHVKCKKYKKENLFETIINSIRLLVNERNSQDRNTLIGVQFIFDNNNYKGITNATKLAKEIGVDYVELRRLQFSDLLKDKEAVNKKVTQEIQNLISDSKKKYETDEFIVFKRIQRKTLNSTDFECESNICRAPALEAVIGADQNVYVCGGLRYIKKYSLGKIGDSFWDIWESSERKEMLAKLKFKECAKYCGYKPYTILNEVIDYIRKKQPHSEFL